MTLDFDQQFQERISVPALSYKIETLDLVPPNLKSPIPVVLAPGRGMRPEDQIEFLRAVYESGRRIITFVQPHRPPHSESFQGFPRRQVYKARVLHQTIEELGIEKAHFIAHSEGAIYTSIALAINSEPFQSITYVAPAGSIGSELSLTLGWRFLRAARKVEVTRQQARDQIAKDIEIDRSSSSLRAARSLARFFYHGWHDASSISRVDIYPLAMAARKKGIPVAVIGADLDLVFRVDRMQAHFARSAKKYHLDGDSNFGLNNFQILDRVHDINNNPKPLANEIDRLLTLFDSK